jgi:hypothetical protein
MVRARARWLASLVLAVVGASGCSGGGVACADTFQYRIIVDVMTAPRGPCQVDFISETKVASYAFQMLPEPYPPPCSYEDAQPPCTPLDGSPQPSGCGASACSINIDFRPDIARDLSTFMGADSFRMQVTCGGQVVQGTTVQPVTQICGV